MLSGLNRNPMKKFLLLSLVLFYLSQNVLAQSFALKAAIRDSLGSEILGESREIFVHLPHSYDPKKATIYPVAYVLDGEVHASAAATVLEYYWGGFMPEMIVVGISNSKNRNRDLTISKVAWDPTSGEAEKFTNFIKNELIPFVDNKYPSAPYRTLIGHSYGGLFAINTLLYTPDLFQNYLAIDPSLDWDNEKLLNAARDLLIKDSYYGKSLFISLAGPLNMQDSEMGIDEVMKDSSFLTQSSRSKIGFRDLVGSSETALNFHWKYYPNDLHGTVPLPSIMDGLIQLFDWYQLENTDKYNRQDTPMEELKGLILKREKKLASYLGYNMPPLPEDLLNAQGYMNLEMGYPEKSLMYFQFNTQYYPESANAFDSLADYYEAQQDYTNALKNVTRAYELSRSDYHKRRIETLKSKVKNQ